MAAKKRQGYRFLSSKERDFPIASSDYEFTESDIWSGNSASSVAASAELRRPSSRVRPKSNGGMSASLPVNVPDWSKILKEDYNNNSNRNKWADVAEDDEEEEGEGWIPPHEYLARTRMASLSVHEGVGRTLKGRDLSRVRNAIWEKIGFQD